MSSNKNLTYAGTTYHFVGSDNWMVTQEWNKDWGHYEVRLFRNGEQVEGWTSRRHWSLTQAQACAEVYIKNFAGRGVQKNG